MFKGMLKKCVALFVALNFVFTGSVFSDTQISDTRKSDMSTATLAVQSFSLPKDFGTVKDFNLGQSDKLVLYIQDAHCNYEAQTNIANILEYLIQKYNLNFVAVEGADGIVDTSWFRAFPDADIKKDVANYFMEKGEITGAEFLSITSDYPFTIYGAEDREYYIKNLNSFLESYPYKEEFEQYYTQVKGLLAKLKKHIYNKELYSVDAKISEHKEKKIEFAEYITFLRATCATYGISTAGYPNFVILLQALAKEKEIDFDVVNEERASLIDKLSKKLDKNTLSELVNKSLAFKMGKIEGSDFYMYLNDLALKNGIDLSQGYMNLSKYITYTKIYAKINNEQLFDEIDLIIDQIKEKLFTNNTQRQLDRLWKNVVVTLGFMNLELTNKEYEYYLNNKSEFVPSAYTGFIAEQCANYGINGSIDMPDAHLNKVFEKLIDFYEIAIKRDKILVDNMFKGMKGKKVNTAALITGGFHTKGITKFLKEENVSYIVISPSITEDVESPYFQVLTGQTTPFEELLMEPQAEGATLAPASKLTRLAIDEMAKMPEDAKDEFYVDFAQRLIRAHLLVFGDQTTKDDVLAVFDAAAENVPNKQGTAKIRESIDTNFQDIYNAYINGSDRGWAYESISNFKVYVSRQMAEMVKSVDARKGENWMQNKINAYRQATDANEKKAIAAEIDAELILYNAGLVNSEVGADLDTLTDDDLVQDLPLVQDFFDNVADADDYLKKGREYVFNSQIAYVDMWGGAASRLFGEGQNVDPKLSYAAHTVYDVADSLAMDIPENALTDLSVGGRLMIQEWLDVEQKLKASYGETKTDEQIVQMRKDIVWNTPRIVIMNDESGESIVQDFLNNKFYGHNPELVVFVTQPTYNGYSLDAFGNANVDEDTRSLPIGHGDATMQVVLDGRAFTLDMEGNVSTLKDNAVAHVEKVTNGRTKLFVQSRVNDMIKLGMKSPDAIEQNLPIAEVDDRVLALALYQIETQGKNAILEQVGQSPDPAKQVKGSTPLRVNGKEISVETLAQSPKVKDLVNKIAGLPFNRFYIFYTTEGFKVVKKKGLPVYMRFRDGYLYPETVTGDITFIDGMDTGYACEIRRLINDYKKQQQISIGLEAVIGQDANPSFRQVVGSLERQEQNIKGLDRAPGFEATKEGDAITLTGEELTPIQHAEINAVIKEAFEKGLAKKVRTLDGVDIYEIPGLEQFDDFLVAHAGLGGEAMSHKAQQVYVSPTRLAWVEYLSVPAQHQFWRHETAHPRMRLENASVTEQDVQDAFPIDKVLAEAASATENLKAALLENAKEAIQKYLTEQQKSGSITKDVYDKAIAVAYDNLAFWMTDTDIARISPLTQPSLISEVLKAQTTGDWKNIVEAFRQDITFGTAGIRGKSVLSKEDFYKFVQNGAQVGILKGPNTINDIVLLLKTAGVIKLAKQKGWKKVAIGYDSRINGEEFAKLIAQSFLGQSDADHSFKVFLFDNVSPFPELSFATTTKDVRADIGILISASHNPADYNGYKITDNTGQQLTGDLRDEIVASIETVTTSDIKLANLADAAPGQLVWLGGDSPLEGKDYEGVDVSKPENFIDMHKQHVEQVKKFVIDQDVVDENADKVKIGFSAFNGAGREAVPRLLNELGFTDVKVVSELQKLDGTFPAFGWGEQPDPGDPISADIAVKEFVNEHGQEAFDDLDILIGTDPDADRAGIIVKVPESQQKYFGKYKLLSANDAWTLLLWYRFMREKQLNGGEIADVDKKYITFSHVTTDALEKVASSFGVASMGEMLNKAGEQAGTYLNGKRSWVGFSYIGAFANMMREKGLINVGGAEESNGFSILGGPIADGEVLSDTGHVNDKDGAFAAVLLAEVAAYAKANGTSLFELLDGVYLDDQIGFFATANKPLPRVGSFEGAAGVTQKMELLKVAQGWAALANEYWDDPQSAKERVARLGGTEHFYIAGKKVIGAIEFKTGKYDKQHYEGFPDEGIRFFFEDEDLVEGEPFYNSRNFITIRPSGTSQTIRFYTQLFGADINEDNLAEVKYQTSRQAEALALAAQKQLLSEMGYGDYIANVEDQMRAAGFDVQGIEDFVTGKHDLSVINVESIVSSVKAKAVSSVENEDVFVSQDGETSVQLLGNEGDVIIEKYNVKMGTAATIDDLLLGRTGVVYVEQGKIQIKDQDDNVIDEIDEGQVGVVTVQEGYSIYSEDSDTVSYIAYEAGVAEGIVMQGYNAMGAKATRDRFAERKAGKRKPIMLHVDNTMLPGNSFAEEKKILKIVSDGTVFMSQYTSLEDLSKGFDEKYEHVVIGYGQDVDSIDKNSALAGILAEVKIMPVAKPKDLSKGLPFIREIESAAVVLANTDSLDDENNLNLLLNVMQQLVKVGTEITRADLAVLIGLEEGQSFADRVSALIGKLLVAPQPVTETLDTLIRTRRQILWAA